MPPKFSPPNLKLQKTIRRLLLAPVDFKSDNLRPDTVRSDAVGLAINDMTACKVIFEGWAENLDQCDSSSGNHKADQSTADLEQIRQAVDRVRNQADLALSASQDIITSQDDFARLMVWRLDRAAKDPFGTLPECPEAEVVGNRICNISSSLSEHVSEMLEQLQHVVSLIQESRKKGEKRSWLGKVASWLEKTFKVLAAIFTSGAFIAPLVTFHVSPIALTVLAGGASLASSAATICKEYEERNSNKEANFDKILDFLQQTVPAQAREAEARLKAFQESQVELQNDITTAMETGRRVKINKDEAKSARDEWITERVKLQLMHAPVPS